MRERHNTNERHTMRPTERNSYTATDNDGNVMATNLTRKQATALVNTMHANGIALWIHSAPDDTNGSHRAGAFHRPWFFE